MKGLSLKEKSAYFCIYGIALGLLILSIVFNCIDINRIDYTVLIFFVLVTGITESITLCFNQLSFSTTFAVTIASYILLGPFYAIIIIVVGFLIRVLKVGTDDYIHVFNVPLYGTILNCSMFIISLIVAHLFYIVLGGEFGSIAFNIKEIIIPIIGFSMIYLIVNNFIVAIYIHIRTNKNPLYCFTANIKLTALNYIIMIPFGIILAVAFKAYGYWGIIIPLFPILLVKYTFTYYAEANSQFIQTVETLMNAMEARDKYTQGHSHRVSEIACIIAEELGYNQWKVERLRIAAMLHDVGKIGVSDTILNKPGKLTDEEFNTIKSHPIIGEGIIKDIRKLQYVLPCIKYHHERYDGKGYPEGKSGDELPLDVHIIQLADTIDAMASDRPYRKGLPKEVIIAEISKYAGTQFHPKIVKAYLNIAEVSTELDQIWRE